MPVGKCWSLRGRDGAGSASVGKKKTNWIQFLFLGRNAAARVKGHAGAMTLGIGTKT